MTRYRVSPHPDLRILGFDDESVVFNPHTWQTHLLNPAAALVLDALADSQASADELAAALTDEAGAPAIPAEDIARLLADLAALRLVEPAAPEVAP